MNLVLFDLDNTLLNGDSDYEWGQFLISRGAVERSQHEERNRYFYEQYKLGTLDIDEFLDFQLKPLTKHPRALLEQWRNEFLVERIRPLICQTARNLVQRHRKLGDLCVMVTATNAFVTAPICNEFDIDHLIATIPAQENGIFTGAVRGVPSFREGKIQRVEKWLESFAASWSSFAEIWFYSDSLNDLPLLAKVSHPVAVKPDPVLRAHAQSHGWPIIEFDLAEVSH